MSAGNFEECFALTLKYEGGFVNDPQDNGGATNKGITQDTLSRYFGRPATIADVKNITIDTAQRIYHVNYWNAVRGDDLPAGVDLAVYDFAVNSGAARAIMALQRALHVADDGKIGKHTLDALAKETPEYLINAICKDRLAFLKRLHDWPHFGKGWGARVANVRSHAMAMIHETAKGHGL